MAFEESMAAREAEQIAKLAEMERHAAALDEEHGRKVRELIGKGLKQDRVEINLSIQQLHDDEARVQRQWEEVARVEADGGRGARAHTDIGGAPRTPTSGVGGMREAQATGAGCLGVEDVLKMARSGREFGPEEAEQARRVRRVIVQGLKDGAIELDADIERLLISAPTSPGAR